MFRAPRRQLLIGVICLPAFLRVHVLLPWEPSSASLGSHFQFRAEFHLGVSVEVLIAVRGTVCRTVSLCGLIGNDSLSRNKTVFAIRTLAL